MDSYTSVPTEDGKLDDPCFDKQSHSVDFSGSGGRQQSRHPVVSLFTGVYGTTFRLKRKNALESWPGKDSGGRARTVDLIGQRERESGETAVKQAG